jgi:hypothetical protein
MAWGLDLPCAFGQYFPDGNYVGRDEQLAANFDKLPAEQKALYGHDSVYGSSYSYYVYEKLTSAPGFQRPGLPPFGPIEAHEVPKRFETAKTYKALGSIIQLNNGILAVDADLKRIIEHFEPGMHQFFPIEIVMRKNVAYPKPYFVMAIGQYLDSFSPEQSDPACWTQHEGYSSVSVDTWLMSGLALSRQAMGRAHLWRERRITTDLYCFSDDLMSEMKRLGVRIPKPVKFKEI